MALVMRRGRMEDGRCDDVCRPDLECGRGAKISSNVVCGWANLSDDLVRLIASYCCEGRDEEEGQQRRDRFSDVFAMSAVCSRWRQAVLSARVEGLETCRFELPPALFCQFQYLQPPGGRKAWNRRIFNIPPLPLPLPKLVTASAQWGNADSALVLAMVATETVLREHNGTNRCMNAAALGIRCRDSCLSELLHLWRWGAELGSRYAQTVLGEAFYCGGAGVLSKLPCARDVNQATAWLSMAAMGGDKVDGKDAMLARAELLLAYILLDAQEEALKASKDSGSTCHLIAHVTAEHDRSIQKAIYWFSRASKHGSSEAQEVLRSMYSTGQY
eukprot:CAMPEP_0198246444 /NCGR_PEP_ID=MMETSP1446-20131203/45979_1 /TAXON_ID=1461542 ORGANISM="Unidentified sp, Strain CCMP2111" /NCGR_SAMPLE_ID=MMETSP1446 /ASSEMBLY_ACC=CAM_ASM_001112 /LENGTH=329 /DNA_ID=CAMNT_0043930765 /DNA_START=527 /DNA_END=1516 /DNA_ORIENTATION=+